MQQRINVISLSLPYRLGSVNCYLVDTGGGYVLIDTGGSNSRADLERELEGAGCGPGDLKVIVLTHGDFDHAGNAAYLREKFGARIAMNHADSGMVERGDMFWNRHSGNALFRMIASLLFRFATADRFVPDLYIDDGDDLSEFGFDAQVLAIPGHSKGSIGILTAQGDLFCGDLLANDRRPARGSIVDDSADCDASLDRLKSLQIAVVYPGHGRPFPMGQFMEDH